MSEQKPSNFKVTVRTNVEKDEKHQETREGKFGCDQCKNSFATLSSLKRHNDSIHKGIRRYKCDSCQLAYSDKRTLQNHNSKVHQVS